MEPLDNESAYERAKGIYPVSILDWFTAGPDSAKKVLDAGINGIDALVFTDEEKAVMRQKLGDQWIELQKALGEETTVRSVTRRILAVTIMAAYTVLVLSAAIVYGLDAIEYAKFLLELAESKFGWLAAGVGAFYFGPYMLGRMGSNKK